MGRSTRNKVRYQIERAAVSIDSSLEHLKNAADLADGQSTPINKNMPKLVNLLVAVKSMLLKFRNEL